MLHPVFHRVAAMASHWSDRMDLTTPWGHDGHAYASNRHVAARCPWGDKSHHGHHLDQHGRPTREMSHIPPAHELPWDYSAWTSHEIDPSSLEDGTALRDDEGYTAHVVALRPFLAYTNILYTPAWNAWYEIGPSDVVWPMPWRMQIDDIDVLIARTRFCGGQIKVVPMKEVTAHEVRSDQSAGR